MEPLQQIQRSIRSAAVNSVQARRLEEALSATASRLESLKVDASPPRWVAEAEKHLENAQTALTDRRIDTGWAHVEDAQRAAVAGLTPDELNALMVSLRQEAKAKGKLKEWRARAVLEQLDAAEKTPPSGRDKRVACVQEAMRLRDEHFQNVYRQISLERGQVLRAAWAVALALAALLGITLGQPDVLGGDDSDLLRVAMLFGLFAGALSTGMSFGKAALGESIPRMLRSDILTWFRPIIGAGGAVAVFVFLKAGVLDFLGTNVGDSVWMVATVSFLAGFSERWFLGIVGKVSKKGE